MLKNIIRGLLFQLLLALAKAKFYIVCSFAERKAGIFCITEENFSTSADYLDKYFTCADGLRLHFRDYPHADARMTVLCLHGLTRNAADFDEIAEVLSHRYRVIVVDQRGRGLSDYDPKPKRYRPDVYVQDTLQLIRTLDLNNLLLIGTSMGALMGILMGAMMPQKFSGIILNEAGPVIETAGLEKIKSYLKNARPVTSWEDAETLSKQMYSPAFPIFNDQQWQQYTRKSWFDDGAGKPAPACDPAVSQATINHSEVAVPANLWPLFKGMYSVPVLVIRGELSEILAAKTVTEMCRQHPNCEGITVPNVGHAPTLQEPEAETAILAFAERCRRNVED